MRAEASKSCRDLLIGTTAAELYSKVPNSTSGGIVSDISHSAYCFPATDFKNGDKTPGEEAFYYFIMAQWNVHST